MCAQIQDLQILKMNPKEVVHNTAYSVQLPHIAGHSLYYLFVNCIFYSAFMFEFDDVTRLAESDYITLLRYNFSSFHLSSFLSIILSFKSFYLYIPVICIPMS